MKNKLCIITLALCFSARSFALLEVDPVRDPDVPRNSAWLPLGSLLLPGLGQYIESQGSAGAFYTGVAAGGALLANGASSGSETDDFKNMADSARQRTYGLQLYQFAGEMSAFHTFRTRIETLKPHGMYTFVTKERSTDLMLAPFEPEHFIRPTTFIPLLGLLAIEISRLKDGSYVDFGDGAFTGGVSYNAGVGEEALFRGYLMPVLHQNLGSAFWANAIQGTVFGAAHLSGQNKLPVIQGLMGFYLGWLTQRNQYSNRQSVFLHTWWDVIAIGFEIANSHRNDVVARPIPLLNITY